MQKKNMHTSFVRTRQQLKKEKARKYKPKVKYIEQISEACNVDKEQDEMAYEKNETPCEQNEMSCEQNEMPCEDNETHEEDEMACEENVDFEMEIERPSEAEIANINVKKRAIERPSEAENANVKRRGRGPTKVKRLPLNLEDRIEVEFNEAALPIGAGSVRLSSYLGPLVREHVPFTLDDWRLLSDDLEAVLWESIQARFKVGEQWKKTSIIQQMGVIWRTSKSRLVRKLINATTEEERLGLKPYNIKNMQEWRKFVKAKTSLEFKARSEKFRAIKQKQLPHTTGRRGIARLTDDLKTQSQDSSSVSRVDVWVKSHTKKNGEPVNTDVANALEEIKKIDNAKQSCSTNNVKEDAIVQVLGQDKSGRLRALGRGYTATKQTLAQSRDSQINQCQKRISELESMVHMLMNKQGKDCLKDGSTLEMSNDNICELLNWNGTDEIVAEGRVVSADPNEVINDIRIGPNAMKVVIDRVKKTDAYLWRPTPSLSLLREAENKAVAWPANRVVALQGGLVEDIMSKTSNTNNKCKLYDWNEDEVLVAEGRFCSNDSKMIVNGIPLGPLAVVVWVDYAKKKEAFLWRPTTDMSCVKEAVGRKIAWPKSKVITEIASVMTSPFKPRTTVASSYCKAKAIPQSANLVATNRCKLIDVGETGRVVAEGTIASIDPTTMVHCVPLGKNAVKIWVDFVKVRDALLWRPTSECTCMEDAFGTTIAWPAAYVVGESSCNN